MNTTPSYNAAGQLTPTQVAYLQNAASNSQIGQVILGSITGANMNSTADQAITISSSSYIIRRIVVTGASISLTTAQGSLYTAASKGGTALTTSPTTTPYSALTTATKYLDLTLASLDRQTVNTIYLALTTAQGATATANIFIFGDKLD